MKKPFRMLAALWGILTLLAWFGPKAELSDAERRPLAQFPKISAERVLSGKFMTEFESYSLDQFPLRDIFRQIKAIFHYQALRQKDNNGIYLSNKYAAQQLYPLQAEEVEHAQQRLQYLHEKFLKYSKVVLAIVPDKGYYLADISGQPRIDYDSFYQWFWEEMTWAKPVDLRPILSVTDYYRTDTHWRQEKLIPAAAALCEALGVAAPQAENYRATALERPFYGVYYGQAALPMEPEAMYLMESDLLDGCSVLDYESGKTLPVYDRSREDGKDLYEVYLAGPRSLLTITNPKATNGRELLIFRDSFGSSIAPLLVDNYAKVTLIDLRYIQIDVLDQFVDFHGQDVLLLYSTLVLNNGSSIK